MTIVLQPSNQNVSFDDLTNLDAFGRLRVSSSRTLFDSQQEYGLDTIRTWDATANGTLSNATGQRNGFVVNGSNAVGPRDVNTRLTPITCSSTDTHYAVLQTRQYIRYIPGKGHLVFLTGIFSPGAASAMSIVTRTSTSGSVSDAAKFSQGQWNIDRFDGTGPSGITLDFTKTQILVISAQWLGVGRVIVGFDVNGMLYPAHQFLNANNLSVPYCQTFNLPIRMEVRTVGTTTVARSGYFDASNGVFLEASRATAGGTIYYGCTSAQSEGGEESRGFPNSSPVVATATAVTVRRPVLSIRPRTTFSGITNRVHIDDIEFMLRATTNDSFYELVFGGTLTGAAWLPVGTSVTAGAFIVGLRYVIFSVGTTNFTLIGAASNTIGVSFVATGVGVGTGTAVLESSSVEYDTTATAITGGISFAKGFAVSAAAAIANLSSGRADLRGSITLSKIDALAATQDTITIVCTSLNLTSNINPAINWYESVI